MSKSVVSRALQLTRCLCRFVLGSLPRTLRKSILRIVAPYCGYTLRSKRISALDAKLDEHRIQGHHETVSMLLPVERELSDCVRGQTVHRLDFEPEIVVHESVRSRMKIYKRGNPTPTCRHLLFLTISSLHIKLSDLTYNLRISTHLYFQTPLSSDFHNAAHQCSACYHGLCQCRKCCCKFCSYFLWPSSFRKTARCKLA